MKKANKDFRFSDEESGRLIFLIHQYSLRELNDAEIDELIYRLDVFRFRVDPVIKPIFLKEKNK